LQGLELVLFGVTFSAQPGGKGLQSSDMPSYRLRGKRASLLRRERMSAKPRLVAEMQDIFSSVIRVEAGNSKGVAFLL